jgi:acetyl esterase/lipase
MTRFNQSTQERPAGLPADLTLRFGAERLRGRVHWPATTSPSPLIFILGAAGDRDAFGTSLSAAAGAVVLWFETPCEVSLAAGALGWAAEHAPELGSDPRALVVGGVDVGGGRAVSLAIAARDHGWPALHRQLLLHPMFDTAWEAPASGTGLAPATVVTTTPPEATASRHVAGLRAAGVDIDELRVPYRGLPRGTELDAVVHSLRLNTHH